MRKVSYVYGFKIPKESGEYLINKELKQYGYDFKTPDQAVKFCLKIGLEELFKRNNKEIPILVRRLLNE